MADPLSDRASHIVHMPSSCGAVLIEYATHLPASVAGSAALASMVAQQ